MRRVLFYVMTVLLSVSLMACKTEYPEHDAYLNKQQGHYRFYVELIDQINAEVIPATLQVFYGSGSYFMNGGSGVIYEEDETHYYALSNHHVVYQPAYSRHQVKDVYGNTHAAELLISDMNYDLAVLKFAKPTYSLPILMLGQENPIVGTSVYPVGFPIGQRNAISGGVVERYRFIAVATVNVTFAIIQLNAPVKPGNSGSVLINQELEIIGIIYAGQRDENGEILPVAFAIPLKKIIEFLELYEEVISA